MCLFVFAFAAFKSFPLSNHLLAALHTACAPRFRSFYNSQRPLLNTDDFGLSSSPEELGVTSAADFTANRFVDERKLVGNTTFSGRTKVWKSVVPALRARPFVLLRGQSSKHMMDIQNNYIDSDGYITHMHNMYLQTLMLLGLPGLLAVLVWTVLLVRKMLRCFFGRRESVPLKAALYSIPLAAVFVFNLLEINIFAGLDISGLVFFLLAGLFLAEVRELPADQTRSPAP